MFRFDQLLERDTKDANRDHNQVGESPKLFALNMATKEDLENVGHDPSKVIATQVSF